LLGGSYTHPDGYIELDFDAKAGNTREDSTEEQFSKIDRLARRETIWARAFGSGLIGLAFYWFADGLHIDSALGIGAAAALGVWILIGTVRN